MDILGGVVHLSLRSCREGKGLTITISWGGRVIHKPRFAPNAYCKVQNYLRARHIVQSKGYSMARACKAGTVHISAMQTPAAGLPQRLSKMSLLSAHLAQLMVAIQALGSNVVHACHLPAAENCLPMHICHALLQVFYA